MRRDTALSKPRDGGLGLAQGFCSASRCAGLPALGSGSPRSWAEATGDARGDDPPRSDSSRGRLSSVFLICLKHAGCPSSMYRFRVSKGEADFLQHFEM